MIRPVSIQDNADLARMIRQVFDEHGAPHAGTVYSDPTTDDLFHTFQVPGAALFVYDDGAGHKACCGIYPTPGLAPHHVELVKFYAPTALRGKGIGALLLNRCMQEAHAFGYTHMYLECHSVFQAAVQLYTNNGFIRVDHPLGNSGHGGCNIWMLKSL